MEITQLEISFSVDALNMKQKQKEKKKKKKKRFAMKRKWISIFGSHIHKIECIHVRKRMFSQWNSRENDYCIGFSKDPELVPNLQDEK